MHIIFGHDLRYMIMIFLVSLLILSDHVICSQYLPLRYSP